MDTEEGSREGERGGRGREKEVREMGGKKAKEGQRDGRQGLGTD